MNQVLLLEIKHKALSIQIAQQKARLRIHTTLALVGIDDSHSAEPVNTEQPAQPSQLPPVIVEEQSAEAEEPVEPEEEEEEPDFNSYAAMAAPVALSGWVTTHNATVELKAAYEAHRNTYGESHSIPSNAHHTPSYSTAEYDAGEAF